MTDTSQSENGLSCPECQAVLPIERRKNPWCECGWSSVPEDWRIKDFPASVRRSLIRSKEYSLRMEKIDERAAHLFDHPWGRWLWKLYLGVTLLLCSPVFLIKIIVFLIFLAAWGYALYTRPVWLLFIMSLVTLGIILYNRLTKPEKVIQGITLNRQTSTSLFEMIDEVATRLDVSPVKKAVLFLEPMVGVRHKVVWGWPPHFENELMIGLLSLYTLTMGEFKSVLAHELGHIKQKDPLVGFLLADGLRTIQSWNDGTWELFSKMFQMRALLALALLPLLWILSFYLRLTVWVSRWAMRREEYTADRISAQFYGTANLHQSLIKLGAVGIGFRDYMPTIMQRIDNNLDRHDFYYQFTEMWGSLMLETSQLYNAKAIASFNTVYDTHPSYKSRKRLLERLKLNPQAESDKRPALGLLPNAAERGRELTIQILQRIYD